MIPNFARILLSAGGGSFLNQSVDGTTFNFSATAGSPAVPASGVRIATDRDIDERALGSYFDRDDWLTASGTASNYEVRFTYVSGSPAGGDAAGSFYALTTDRETFINQTIVGTSTAEVTVDIRKISNTSDAIQFTVNLEAIRT